MALLASPLPPLSLRALLLAFTAAAATPLAVSLRTPCHPFHLQLAFTGKPQAAGVPPSGSCSKDPPSHAGRCAAAHTAARTTLPPTYIADTGYS